LMKKVALKFTYEIDLIEVPDTIADEMTECQAAFDRWLYDENNEHSHWILQDGEKVAVSFDSQTFVEFLNKYILLSAEEKAIVLKRNVLSVSDKIPVLFF